MNPLQDGTVDVEMKKKISKKDKKEEKLKKKGQFYGGFIKSATLQAGEMIESKKEIENEVIEDKNETDKGTVKALTDEELFEACGGLTAHK